MNFVVAVTLFCFIFFCTYICVYAHDFGVGAGSGVSVYITTIFSSCKPTNNNNNSREEKFQLKMLLHHHHSYESHNRHVQYLSRMKKARAEEEEAERPSE